MRSRMIFSGLLLALTLGTSAMGCQVLVGLTVLDTNGGGGAAASASSGAACEPGQPCGDLCAGNVAFPKGICDPHGVCPGQPKSCKDMHSICVPGPMPGDAVDCRQCGIFPKMSTSECKPGDGCPSCDAAGKSCEMSCDGMSCGAKGSTRTLDATQRGARLLCNGPGACDGVTIVCNGPFPCDVVCDGGCVGVRMECSPEGPCSLSCKDMSCMNTTLECGDNSCLATCTQMPPAVKCNDSCGCAQPVCAQTPP